MVRTDDQAYFAQRAREERQRAKTAADIAIAHVHLRLATEYERRLEDTQKVPRAMADATPAA